MRASAAARAARATRRQAVHVLAYGGVPMAASLGIWVLTALIAGEVTFVQAPKEVDDFVGVLLGMQFLSYVVLLMWSVVLQVMGFSEILAVSNVKAFGIWVLGQLIAVLAILFVYSADGAVVRHPVTAALGAPPGESGCAAVCTRCRSRLSAARDLGCDARARVGAGAVGEPRDPIVLHPADHRARHLGRPADGRADALAAGACGRVAACGLRDGRRRPCARRRCEPAARAGAAGLAACAFLSALFAAFFASFASLRSVLSCAFASRTRFFASAACSTARFAAAARRRLAALLLTRCTPDCFIAMMRSASIRTASLAPTSTYRHGQTDAARAGARQGRTRNRKCRMSAISGWHTECGMRYWCHSTSNPCDLRKSRDARPSCTGSTGSSIP